jgi:hypothetical protein
MRLTDVLGLGGHALLVAALVTAACGKSSLERPARLGLIAGAFLAVLLPFGGLPFAGWLRGGVGDLSSTSVLLLALFVRRGLRAARARVSSASAEDPSPDTTQALAARGCGEAPALRWLLAAAGVFLYPAALGMSRFDPYRLGYGSPWFLAVLLLVALAAWRRGWLRVTSCLALAVLGWSLGLLESRNLWDYLMDPIVFAWALVGIGASAWRTRVTRLAESRTHGG